MAVFQSKYRELSFYVEGSRYSFSSGTLTTDDERVIAVLETMPDVIRNDSGNKPEELAQVDDKAAKAPAPTKRKANATSSAK
ncbi:hypothetical protein [Paenibacillus amylolyticus]|uniref:hypothetical protein n=1 Tax=Paenibacillus amylolyticus TaxID=1451 RepID=UPI003EBEE9AB